MCGSSNTVTLRKPSRPTASAIKRTLLASKPSRWLRPRRPSVTNNANTPKRWYSALRMAALEVCGRMAALTSVEHSIPREISSTRHTAAMKAPSGWARAGSPTIAAV